MTNRRTFVAFMTFANTPLLSAQGQVTDVPTGPEVGVEVGLINFGGSSGSVIGAGTAYTIFAGYAIQGRWQFNGGFQYSSHGLENVIDRYQVVTAFLESRYRLFSLTLRIQPFVGARVGRRWESVTRSGANFNAVGHLFGGSGGFLYKMGPQLGLEIGSRFTTTAFGDFVFSGDQAWESCLERHRLIQTALPLAVVDCSPPRSFAQISTTLGGRRVRFSHDGSARSGGALTFWMRIILMQGGY